MKTTPMVTILMCIYNGEEHLVEAMNSMLGQTLTNFEFLIIDDGSTDRTPQVLRGYDDPRITVVNNEGNIGLTKSLNKGLKMARGEYIARMDADDVSMPNRLQKQVTFLDRHPEVGILGGPCLVIQRNHRDEGVYRVPTSDLEIRWRSLLANPFIHPTVMIRRDVLTQNDLKYDEALAAAQDYDLWRRALNHTCGANLSNPLLRYRVHYDSVTAKDRRIQLENHDIVALRIIREQLPEIDIRLEQVSQLRALFVGGREFISGLDASDLDARRVVLAEVYLDMLKAFANRHCGKPDLRRLQRQEVLRIADLVCYRPLQRGWMRVVGRLMTEEPCFVLRYFACRLGRRAFHIL